CVSFGFGGIVGHRQAARTVAGAAEKYIAHLVERLFAELDAPRRIERVVGVLGAIVVIGVHVEMGVFFDLDSLLEHVGLLPVVIPLLNGHQRRRWAIGRRHGHLDFLAD